MDARMFEISGYNITADTSFLDKKYNITPEIEQILQDIYPDVKRAKPYIIKKLKKYCRRYPHVPHFKNYLGAAYENAGKNEEMLEVNRQIIQQHPEYLFGKLSYAGILMKEGEPGKVPDILGEKMDLKALYPERSAFHLREVLGFFRICVQYYLAVDKPEHADPYLEIMNEIGAGEPETKEASNRYTQYLLEGTARRMKEEDERRRSVESRSYDKNEQTTEKPAFNHPEIEALYSNDMRVDHNVIRGILELPRTSLIEDLETVVEDSIRRFEYFRGLERQYERWKPEEFSFVLHALFLLAELKAEESLPVLLRLFRQGEELLEFWFGDMLVQMGVEVICSLGRHQLAELQAFMKEKDNYTYARNAIHTAVTQLVLHNPTRRKEVTDWFDELFLFFLENAEDDRIIDTDLISLMVADCVDLRATELKDIIRNLYEHGLVERGITGTLDEVLRDMRSGRYKPDKYEIYDIYSRYDYLAEVWYSDPEESEFKAALQKSPDDESGDQNQPAQTAKYTGRNDPCPCGSGKKYKYCCLN